MKRLFITAAYKKNRPRVELEKKSELKRIYIHYSINRDALVANLQLFLIALAKSLFTSKVSALYIDVLVISYMIFV